MGDQRFLPRRLKGRGTAVRYLAAWLTSLLNLLEAAGAVRMGRRVQPAADAPPPQEAAATPRERAGGHRSVERSRVEMTRR